MFSKKADDKPIDVFSMVAEFLGEKPTTAPYTPSKSLLRNKQKRAVIRTSQAPMDYTPPPLEIVPEFQFKKKARGMK